MFHSLCAIAVVIIASTLVGCSNEPSATAAVVGKVPESAFTRTSPVPRSSPRQEAKPVEAGSSVSIVSGEESGPYSHILADLAATLERERMSLRPAAGRGAVQDILDLLHRPEIDAAVVQTDAVDALRGRARAAARDQLRYLFRVPNKELHILAPREITAIRELAGRKVNIDRPGTGTHVTARAVFENLGIRPEFTTFDQATARLHLEAGDIDAAILLESYPSSEVLAFPSDGRFHLVPIPFDEPVSDYPPGQFTADGYPHLIQPGQRVDTIAVSRVLAVRDSPEGSARHKRVARLAEAIYAGFDELQRSGRDPRWKEIDLSTEEFGWRRVKLVQDLLDRDARQAEEPRAFEKFALASGLCSIPDSTAARLRFYNDFIEWRKEREKVMPERTSAPGHK